MKRLLYIPLLLMLLVALAAFGPEPDPEATASPDGASVTENGIRVLDNSYAVNFPYNIVFSLEAEVDANITNVTFFYRLGDRRVTVYGYPSFGPGNHITATFHLETGSRGSFPVGTDIEYTFLLEDGSGRQYETEPRTAEYLDPSFDWQRVELDNLMVVYHDRSDEQVARVAENVNARLDAVHDMFGLQDTKPMKAVLVNTSDEASRSFPTVSQTADNVNLYAGFAFGEYDVFVMIGINEDTMVHEMAHLILDEAMTSPIARVPSWLNEGLAMYFEDHSSGYNRDLANAIRDDRLIPIRHMAVQPGQPDAVILFYAQANSFVRYLIDSHGIERMQALLGEIAFGRRMDDALDRAYGTTLEDLERGWRTSIGAPLPEPTPASVDEAPSVGGTS
ncbi:MAG: peptidase MA family metallohydrolase, partial [Chloroflexi bacterium]|nr:peptidase MA family metallohydrolase [Chloroflexota bacterium]